MIGVKEIADSIRRRFCRHKHKTYLKSTSYWDCGSKHDGGERQIEYHLVDVFVCDRCGMRFESEIGGHTK